ncbi:hypothetical protein [Paraglaciecola hydrolytica]|uniref:Uncharacterized protein n=1 Tax=Paraglaciecola hydrolytica TaxID=1799789 RepID=A0A148KN20_9ALTE|nr:hypothetical protein [Paraglaciecola hydrolytica]KXI27714.1 hypothetical protein AX660_19375 [Paraglaciecola hydrolytica]
MRKLTSYITTILMLSGLSYSVQAQENNKRLDFVSEQLSVQMLNNIRALSSPELVKAQAEYFRLMYTALIDSGFTKEEALKIVIAMAESK